MTSVTETDLKELKDLISKLSQSQTERFEKLSQSQTERFEKLSQSQTERFEAVAKDFTDLKVSVGKIEATLQAQQPLIQKVPDLAEKVGELKYWKQFLIIGVTSLVSGLIGWLIRGGRI